MSRAPKKRSSRGGGPAPSGGGRRRSGPPKGKASGSSGPSRGGSQRAGGSAGSGGGGGGQSRGRGRGGSRQNRGLGGDQVEGRHAVRELLLADKRRVREVVMIDDLDSADILDDISELCFETKVTLRVVTRRRFETEALTQSHQGVFARAQELPQRDLDDLVTKNAFLLVLDGVTDPGNLGAMLRTAECAGVTGIVLPRHRAVHISPTVAKTAAGAIEHLPMALVGGIPTALQQLQKLGVHTVGLDMGGDKSIFELGAALTQPVALVMGAEGAGLSRLVRQRVETLAAIPMAGQLNSLNVGMASAIACFEVVRRRQEQNVHDREGS